MLKRLFILVCICQSVVAMDSMQDVHLLQGHNRLHSYQWLAPYGLHNKSLNVPKSLPNSSCQPTENRRNDKDENNDKDKNTSSTSQSGRLIETGRILIADAMGRLYRCWPQ